MISYLSCPGSPAAALTGRQQDLASAQSGLSQFGIDPLVLLAVLSWRRLLTVPLFLSGGIRVDTSVMPLRQWVPLPSFWPFSD